MTADSDGARAGRARRRSARNPPRATGGGDGHARDPRRASHAPVTTRPRAPRPRSGLDTTLPVGTVTFLRTDVEGLDAPDPPDGECVDHVNAAHLALIRAAIEGHGGVVVRTEGDACFAAFAEARAGAGAAVELQRAVTAADLDPTASWSASGCTRVRRTWPETTTGGSRSTGPLGSPRLGTAARSPVRRRPERSSPTTCRRIYAPSTLGTHTLKDVARPERLSQLSVTGLRPRSRAAYPGPEPSATCHRG